MEHAYWIRRHREELALARCTTCGEARLIHLDLAGRYRAKAREIAPGLDTPVFPFRAFERTLPTIEPAPSERIIVPA